MIQTSFTDLQDRSNGFLTDIVAQESRIPDTVLITASYHADAFRQSLFDTLQIPCPEKVKTAVDKRRADFLAGRAMAQAAMHQLGHPPVPVSNGADRAPLWPLGLSGSISHARGRCACLLSRETGRYFGVDTEAIATGRSLNAILSETLNTRERAITTEGMWPPGTNATLTFSAKEALFKALYPRVGHHFGFDAAELAGAPEKESLVLTLTGELGAGLGRGTRFVIQHRLTGTHVLTWLSVPAA